MRASNRPVLEGLLLAALLASCSSSTEPRHSDVDLAREAWLAGQATSYTFEVAIATSWTPKSGYFRVRVENKMVVAATDASGQPADNFTLTIDELWDRLLGARARGELNSALFNRRGVPVETDMGPWPSDGGVHYSVQRFAQAR
jgi:hypothetical protein